MELLSGRFDFESGITSSVTTRNVFGGILATSQGEEPQTIQFASRQSRQQAYHVTDGPPSQQRRGPPEYSRVEKRSAKLGLTEIECVECGGKMTANPTTRDKNVFHRFESGINICYLCARRLGRQASRGLMRKPIMNITDDGLSSKIFGGRVLRSDCRAPPAVLLLLYHM